MAPPSAEELTARFGALSPEEQAAFVTDLRVSYTHPGTQALVQVTVEHDTACTTDISGWYDEARTDVRRRP